MRKAFSLVEVLLAILILALGLLGLGAIIPVVVKQQRAAGDMTLGVVAANSAKGYLLSRPEFSTSAVTGVNVWDHWLADTNWSPTGNAATDHLWEPWPVNASNKIDLTTGDMSFNGTPANRASLVILSIDDRLWPAGSVQPFSQLGNSPDLYKPRFVWDLVGRRIATAPNAPEAVQVAIFVRRIDLNIRMPQVTNATRNPITLRDVLTGKNGVQSSQRCVPVAVMSANDPTPTNHGNSTPGARTYGNFLSLDATYDPIRRNRITLSVGTVASNGSPDTLLALASEPDQKLLDNFGNVYTVVKVDEDASSATQTVVIVSPSVPPSVPDPNSGSPQASEFFRQVLFTPQVAAAVEVFTVTRPIK